LCGSTAGDARSWFRSAVCETACATQALRRIWNRDIFRSITHALERIASSVARGSAQREVQPSLSGLKGRADA
jgi:hypothetical protein